MKVTKKYLDDLTYEIIGAAIEVHNVLGSGLLESIYHKCMKHELILRGIKFESEVPIPIIFKGVDLGLGYRCDLIIEENIIVELKSVEKLVPINSTQIISHINLMEKPKGILINFNYANIVNYGKKTFVNELYRSLPDN